MQITELNLHGFRHFDQKKFQFDSKALFIQGQNGAGKTAILEALSVLFYGRSFRTNQIRHMVNANSESNSDSKNNHSKFIISARIFNKNLNQNPNQNLDQNDLDFMAVQKDLSGESVLKLNQQNINTHIEFAKKCAINILHPDMTSQILSERKSRRQLLDWGVFYNSLDFSKHWSKYQRALKHRNNLLKNPNINYANIKPWDYTLAQLGQKIHEDRLDYIPKFNKAVSLVLKDILEEHQIQIKYHKGWVSDNTQSKILFQHFKDHFENDKKLGYTSIGPHRADLSFKIGAQNVKTRLSRGQQKRLIWGVKLAQSIVLKENNLNCLNLIDDISAELDQNHQSKLLEIYFRELDSQQLFLTGIHSILDLNLDLDLDKKFQIIKLD